MVMRWLSVFLGLSLLVGFGLSAPGGEGDGKNLKKVDIRGNVTKITFATEEQKASGLLGVLFVEGKKQPNTEHAKAHVKIDRKTKIWVVSGDTLRPGLLADIKEGVGVEISFTGPVAESYPVQATAGRVKVFGKT
jgi:hypothetical protein